MNIIISGYGKMGKAIEKAALSRGHKIIFQIDKKEDWQLLQVDRTAETAVIDFSQPDVVVNNIIHCFEMDLPVVVGTTGWNQHVNRLKETCLTDQKTLFVASNFSIGMNIFFAVNKYLAKLMADKHDYEVSIAEKHHIHKLDKPSGTAITLAEEIINRIDRKNNWVLDKEVSSDDLGIHSVREGEIIGDHSIQYSSPFDEISIQHKAKNRKGFAMGAILAAEWVHNKKGFFEMKDMLGL